MSKKMLGYVGLAVINFLAVFIICGVGYYGYSAVGEFGAMEKVGLVFALETACRCAICPISGKLGEKVGRKQLLIVALCLYILGYGVAAFTHSMTVFLATRVVCGLAWGCWMSNSFIIFCDIFGQDDAPKYSSIAQTMTTVAMLIGGPLAGIICGINWRLEFYITVPLLIVLTILCAIGIPNNIKSKSNTKMDLAGSIFCMLFLIPFSLVMSTGSTSGWTSGTSLILIALTVIGLIGIIISEKKAADPIFPMHVLRNKSYLAVFMVSFFYSIISAVGNYTPTYLQYYAGVSSAASGFVGTPAQIICLIVTALIGARISKTGKYKGTVTAWWVLTAISALLYLLVGKPIIASIPVLTYFMVMSVPVGTALSMQQIVPYTYYMKVLEPKDLAAGGSFLIFASLFATAVSNGLLGALMNSSIGLPSIFYVPIVCVIFMIIFGIMFKDVKTKET